MVVGTIFGELSSAAGFIAATVAVCGFLAHAPRPALAREPEAELRRATVLGGLAGLALAVFVFAVTLWPG